LPPSGGRTADASRLARSQTTILPERAYLDQSQIYRFTQQHHGPISHEVRVGRGVQISSLRDSTLLKPISACILPSVALIHATLGHFSDAHSLTLTGRLAQNHLQPPEHMFHLALYPTASVFCTSCGRFRQFYLLPG